MEFNKDEAVREKAIAEKKLTEKDYAGAKYSALKAQAMYPGLDGLTQMLATLEVYISGERKVNGEVDWYSVLRLSPSADDEAVRRQYHKLALMLHPDKNKSIGAEGAFKLLIEAWSVLSDKPKRQAYNQRRSAKETQQKVPTHRGVSSASPSAYSSFISKQKVPSVPPPQQRTDPFWTICCRCKMHYEYPRIYVDHTLLCPTCGEAFLASETPAPKNSQTQPKYQNTGAAQNSQPKGSVPFSDTNDHRLPFSSTVGVSGKIPPNVAANIVQQASERLKKKREELHVAGGLEKLLKKRRGLGDASDGSGVKTVPQVLTGHVGAGAGNIFGARKAGGRETDRMHGLYGNRNITRDLTQVEVRNMLMAKTRIEIGKKITEWNAEAAAKAAAKAKEDKAKGKEIEKITEPGSINVPDPDFHDFDIDRTESCFEDNQVWAAYDDDGMPRLYAMIKEVISSCPFEMRISWLNSKTNSEFGPVEWVSRGFTKSCGTFSIGNREINKSLNSFSHKVNWTKGARGTVCVIPRKGDVWALYRNWSPDWDVLTPDEVIQKYDMVEVLEDYTEDQGVSVAPLVKVPGFRTVFRANIDPGKVRRIEKKEMFRFSHQVPNYLLTGLEAQNVPMGCQELDPAAMPLELLQVITEADDAIKEEPEENTGEEKLRSAPPPAAVDEMVDDTPEAEVGLGQGPGSSRSRQP